MARLRGQYWLHADAFVCRLPEGTELRDLLEQGFPQLPEPDRDQAVSTILETTMPRLAEDLETAGHAAWALGYFVLRGESEQVRQRGHELRRAIVRVLRSTAGPPDLTAEWASIPAGTFTMGSPPFEGTGWEWPAHSVTLCAFRMTRYVVTNGQLRALRPRQEGADDLPAVDLTWYRAYAYAAWLGGRLPTEAEWEYLARAGSPHPYADRHGKPTTLDKVSWHDGNSGRRLHAVGKKEPNSWGLYDMYGNIWEWAADWLGPYSPEPQENPWGPPRGELRGLRGGSVWDRAFQARAAARVYWSPSGGWGNRGFRVVLPGPRGQALDP